MKITKVYDDAGEWTAIYIDGVLLRQGHSVGLYDVLYELQKKGVLEFESIEVQVEDHYPELLKDLNIE